MTTTTNAETGTAEATTSPLPQDAQASQPTDAKGTVDERTVTGIEEQLSQEGETAETVTKTGTEDTKEIYTISTKSGKIFYLIVDNTKAQDNVYFLTEVSEKDLMNFTLSDSVTLPEVDTVYAEPEKQTEEETSTEPTETPDKEEEEVQMPEEKSSVGTYLLIGIIVVGVAGAGWYFKVYKPKHEYDDDDELEDDEDESEDSESEKREVDDADEQQEEPAEPEILRDEDFDDAILEDEEEEQE